MLCQKEGKHSKLIYVSGVFGDFSQWPHQKTQNKTKNYSGHLSSGFNQASNAISH